MADFLPEALVYCGCIHSIVIPCSLQLCSYNNFSTDLICYSRSLSIYSVKFVTPNIYSSICTVLLLLADFPFTNSNQSGAIFTMKVGSYEPLTLCHSLWLYTVRNLFFCIPLLKLSISCLIAFWFFSSSMFYGLYTSVMSFSLPKYFTCLFLTFFISFYSFSDSLGPCI